MLFRGPRAAPLAVGAAAVLVYLNSLSNGFAFDDLPIIVDNATAHDPTNLARIWFTPYWPGTDGLDRGLYRPLTIFLFSIQWVLGSGSALPFHVSNVVLHTGASLLVYRLLHQLVSREGAFFGALLFAVHPVHVEAVANGVGQAEVFSATCLLAATTIYAERPRHGDLAFGRRMLLVVLYLAGLLAKEHAIVLPALLVAVDVAQGRVDREKYPASVVRLLLLLSLVPICYLALRFAVLQGSLTGDASASLGFLHHGPTRVRTALSIWLEYARLLVFPAHLSAMYDPATIEPKVSVTMSVIAGGLVLAGVVISMLLPSAWPALGLGSAWFVVTILLVSNLLVPIGTVLAERTLYLPSVAGAIWVAFGVRAALRSLGRHPWVGRALPGLMVCVVLAYGTRTVVRNPVWSDNETLFDTTLRDHPENFRAHWFRALRLDREGDPAGSRRSWERAMEIYPGDVAFLTDYALFLLSAGETGRAAAIVDMALELRPEGVSSIYVKGLTDVARGRSDDALEQASRLRTLGFRAIAEELEDSVRSSTRAR